MSVEDKLDKCNLMLDDLVYIITEVAIKNPCLYEEIKEDLCIARDRMANILNRVEYLTYEDNYDQY